jgi:nucleoside-diphosphate-sugar epimerase
MTERQLESAVVLGGDTFMGRHLIRTLGARGVSVEAPAPGDLNEMSGRVDLVVCAEKAGLESALERVLCEGRYEVLVHVSSLEVYAGAEGTARETTPLALDPADPRHARALSLAAREAQVFAHGGPRAIVVRLAHLYDDALEAGGFLADMLERTLAGRGGPVDVPPDAGDDYIHLEDACEAVWAIAQAGAERLYLVASGETVDHQTLLGVLGERAGVPLEPSRPPEGGPILAFDGARLATELGLRPRPLSEGLDQVLTHQHNRRAMLSMMGVTQMPWM